MADALHVLLQLTYIEDVYNFYLQTFAYYLVGVVSYYAFKLM